LTQRLQDIDEEVDKLRRKMSTKSSYLIKAELCQKIGQKRIEEGQIRIQFAGVFKKWAGEHGHLLYALSKLTENEFYRTYASLKRDANWQIQHALAADNQDGSNCHDRDSGNNFPGTSMTNCGRRAGDYTHNSVCTHDCLCSDDRFVNLLATMEQINEKLDKSLLSYYKADLLKWTDHMTAKSSRTFWKRILKH
jgi:hypothetical protein